jgi:tol-pal system protein YbgF
VRALAIPACLAATLGLAGCSLTRPEEDPAYVKASAVEGRVDRIERQNEALLDLQRQLEAVQLEQRRLRGEFEELQHAAHAREQHDRDLYGDLDKRLAALDARLQAQAAAPVGAAAPAAATDRDAYQGALERLKNRDYAGAEQALVDFIATYPQSPLADNAQYWLGEAYYVEHRYADALEAFQRVTRDHPDSRKVPDAMLKVGYSFYEMKRYREAREMLARLVKLHGDAPAAAEARERLKHMDAERR